MNNKFECLGIAVNPILQDQITDFLKPPSIHFSNKKDFKKSLGVLYYALFFKSNYVLVYNSSIFNILLMLILRLRRKNIIFSITRSYSSFRNSKPRCFFCEFHSRFIIK